MGKKDTTLCIGIDVGGTKISAALAEQSGNIIARNRQPTPRNGTAEDSLEAIVTCVKTLVSDAKVDLESVAGVGLGVPGTVDPEKGLVVDTPNMNLSGLRIVRRAEEKLGRPVAFDNDVNLGTLGESWLGAAQGADSTVGIFVGTGIGGAVLVGGKLVRGVRFAAGEIGHIVMEVDGPLCGCGNRGCLEAMASRTAIERDIREAVSSGRETILQEMLDGDLSIIKSGALKKALKKGDGLVTEVMEKASIVIGHACLTVRHLLDPEVIVLGGGVVEACGNFILPLVQEVVDSDALGAARNGGRIVESSLGDDAVILGAVALAKESIGRHNSAK